MSTKSIMFAAAGGSAPVTSWITKLDIGSQLDAGRGIVVDSIGNVYITGQANASTANASYAFVAKYNMSGVIQWQRSLDILSQTDLGYAIAVDGSGNSYVTGTANASTASYAFIAKYNTSGVIQWQRSLDIASQSDAGHGIAVDSSGNSYVCGQAYGSGTASYAFIAKYDTSGVIQWQRCLDTALQIDLFRGICVDTSGNIYTTGYVTGNTLAIIVKYNSSGTITWQRTLDTATVNDFGYGIAVDSSGNVYVTGFSNTTTAQFTWIAKYNTSGVIQWQRSLDTGLQLDYSYAIAVDNTGNSYITGQANASTATAAIAFIAKYNTSGAIQWQRKLDTSLQTDTGYGIAIDNAGYYYITGSGNVTTTAHVFIAKFPTDGTVPGSGTYSFGGSIMTYSGSTVMTDGPASLTDAAGTLSEYKLSVNHWISTYDNTANSQDILYAVAVDGSGNVYVSGASVVNVAASTYAVIAKYNSSGVIQWQRSLDTTGGTDYGYGIAADSAGNVYVCGQAYGSGTPFGYLVKYDTSGAIQWQVIFGGILGNSTCRGVALDSTGNVYVVGQGNTSVSNAYMIIAKYNTSGVIQWQRRLDNLTLAEAGYGIAVDASGNSYVTGYLSTQTINMIAKYNTSGVIQWIRSLDGTTNDISYGIAVDSSGNSYITGSTGSNQKTFVVKYDTSGVIQWQRFLDGTGNDVGFAIAVDGSGNSYVTGYANSAAVFIIKYNTSGAIQWQRSLDIASQTDFGYGIAVDGSDNIYIVGMANATTVTAAYAFIAKFPANGDILYNPTTLPYASSSALTESAGDMTDDDITNLGNCWYATLDTVSLSDIGSGIAVDSAGNVYVTGQTNTATNAYVFIVKYNSLGVIQWKNSLDISANSDIGNGITVDSTGNVYVTGQVNATTATAAYAFVAKYSPGGIILWQRSLDITSQADQGNAIAVDGSGNVYITGQASGVSTASYAFIIKYDTSGVIQWQRTLDVSLVIDAGTGIAVDSSGNSYVTGTFDRGAATAGVFIVKYDTSGIIQWRRSLGVTGAVDQGFAIAVDGSGNSYVTGTANASTASYAFIAKYNTSGVIQWQRSLDVASIADIGYGIAVDGSGNVYITGQASGASTSGYIFIVKYNSSGVIQWQRSLDTALQPDKGAGIAVDNNGYFYVTGTANTTTAAYVFTAKLPVDGTIVAGTAVLTYGLAGMVDSDGVLTDADATGTITDAVGNISDAAGTITAGVSAMPSATISLGVADAPVGNVGFNVKISDCWAVTSTDAATGSYTDNFQGVSGMDSAGNIYTSFVAGSTGAFLFYITKYNNSGVLQWCKTITPSHVSSFTTTNDLPLSMAVSSTGNVYLLGTDSDAASPNNRYRTLIVKLDTNGGVQYQYYIITGNTTMRGNAIAIDSSENIYIVSSSDAATPYVYIAKYDSLLNRSWHRNLTSATNGTGITTDTLGNIYITGESGGYQVTGSNAFVAKYNSSGVVQWQRSLGITGSSDSGFAIACDSSNAVYVVGSSTNYFAGTTSNAFIAKYNTDGIIEWQRTYNSGATYIDSLNSIYIDSLNNIFVSGRGNGNGVVIRYTTIGDVAWCRNIDSAAAADFASWVCADVNSIYVSGSFVANKMKIIKLPLDGGAGAFTQALITGGLIILSQTYGTTVGNLIDAAVTPVDVVGTFGISSISNTVTTVTVSLAATAFGLTGGTPTLTSTTTILGIIDSAASIPDAAGSMTSTTLTIT